MGQIAVPGRVDMGRGKSDDPFILIQDASGHACTLGAATNAVGAVATAQ